MAPVQKLMREATMRRPGRSHVQVFDALDIIDQMEARRACHRFASLPSSYQREGPWLLAPAL